jgi:hypothetical protein
MKAHTGAGRVSTTRSMSQIHGDEDSRYRDVGRPDHERPLSAKQGMKKRKREARKDSRFGMIVAIEQWICVVLGVVCIASGIWGVLLKPSQNALPAYLAWLATAFVPTLRIIAVACLVMGLVLVRRGLAWF